MILNKLTEKSNLFLTNLLPRHKTRENELLQISLTEGCLACDRMLVRVTS